MRTNFDAVDIVWKVLDGSQIKAAIDGKIYKYTRPTNSEKEDVVINALPISPGTPQRCVVNANIYTRNLKLNIGGVAVNSMPDNVRLNALTTIALNAIEDVSKDNHYFFVEQQAVISEEALSQHYTNIRIEFLFTN
ncbi:MAG: hypothetical protein K0B15_12250 [Lentimicrobium sp.]|nr:hypothetical protein [Lentimicrobium sp.]